ncbi:MAG: serine hydrolase, partial [Actinomycetota bacterium]|nr:serine hydrolase [Actinomycetota bacterium]
TWQLGWGLGLELFRRGERIFGGHTGGMPGFVSVLSYSRQDRVGSVLLVSSGAPDPGEQTGLLLTERAVETLAEPTPWMPEATAPAEVAPLLGRWWSEGYEFVFAYRKGRLEARLASAPPTTRPAVFAPDGTDRFRTVSGRERGELLRVVRDEGGEVVKLYWATYPFTRDQRTFS